MKNIIKPPQDIKNIEEGPSIFLAGSIEQGKAEKWQDRIIDKIYDPEFTLNIFNPRRDEWDPSWVNDPTPGTKFHEQVIWELTALEMSDFIILYFAKNTISPISLLEYGLHLKDKPIYCYVDKDYSRYGNVMITWNFYKERELIHPSSYITDDEQKFMELL